MMKRLNVVHAATALALLMLVGTSEAQAQIRQVTDESRHSVGFNLGYFSVRGEDSRVDGDVLVANLFDAEPLLFDVKDFNAATVGGEWLYAVSDYLEVGAGVGFYQRTVPSIYADVVNENGSEIEQDLKLRQVPITATVRFLPLGRGGVEPYVGGGIGFINWKYSEVGEFVDTSDYSVFRDRFVADGTATGPVILAGIRFPVADVWTIGGEVKYQRADGKIDNPDFLGDRIDLGGVAASVTFHIRF
jgi:opacity protein-like surface antigen